MAPSLRIGSGRAGKKQSRLGASFARVTKFRKVTTDNKPTEQQKAVLDRFLKQDEHLNTTFPTKRKRDFSDGEECIVKEGATQHYATPKKVKLQQPSPPASQASLGSDVDLLSPITPLPSSASDSEFTDQRIEPTLCPNPPDTLLELQSLHRIFVKALQVHYAHNGRGTPAELTNLMSTMTQLWKKRAVTKVDIQRMLALYELHKDEEISNLSPREHIHGPFKLMTSGLGSSYRTNVEYVGREFDDRFAPFVEKDLQRDFEGVVKMIFIGSRRDRDCFVWGPIANFPLLACEVGAQTASRQQKASTTRNEILKLSSEAQSRTQSDFSTLTISDPFESGPAAVKSRTLSLFDRVRAKKFASSSASGPDAEAITRCHAIGRIGEVVEIMRMKQQQKLSSHFQSNIHESPSKVKGKVSFSYNTLVHEIKSSVGVPIGDEEVKMCVQILAKEMSSNWCTMYDFGGVKTVTLQGTGKGGTEVQRECREFIQC